VEAAMLNITKWNISLIGLAQVGVIFFAILGMILFKPTLYEMQVELPTSTMLLFQYWYCLLPIPFVWVGLVSYINRNEDLTPLGQLLLMASGIAITLGLGFLCLIALAGPFMHGSTEFGVQ
jgi:hypothetical protein